jgi:hypothetical protein
MQLFSADAAIFLKKIKFFFCPQKVEKKQPQKLLRKTQILLPELPKRPKEFMFQNVAYDQLYIELGFKE